MMQAEQIENTLGHCGPTTVLRDATLLYLKAEAFSLRYTGGEAWEFSDQQERELFMLATHLEEAGSLTAFREKFSIAESNDALKGMLFDRVAEYLSEDLFRHQHNLMHHAIATVFDQLLPPEEQMDHASEFFSVQHPWLLKTQVFARAMEDANGTNQSDRSTDLYNMISWVGQNLENADGQKKADSLLHDVVVSSRLFEVARRYDSSLRWDASGIDYITGPDVLKDRPLIEYWAGIGDIPQIRDYINTSTQEPDGIRVLEYWVPTIGRLAIRLQELENELCEGFKWTIPTDSRIWVRVWRDSVSQMVDEYQRSQKRDNFWRIERLMKETIHGIEHDLQYHPDRLMILPLMVRSLPEGEAIYMALVNQLYRLETPNSAQDAVLDDVIIQLQRNRHAFEKVPLMVRVRIAELCFISASEDKRKEWFSLFPSSRFSKDEEEMTSILHYWSAKALTDHTEDSSIYRAAVDSWVRHLGMLGIYSLGSGKDETLLIRAITSLSNAVGPRRRYLILMGLKNGEAIIEQLNQTYDLGIKYTASDTH